MSEHKLRCPRGRDRLGIWTPGESGLCSVCGCTKTKHLYATLGYQRVETSKRQRKINQYRETVDHLHGRMASLKSSNANKASQVARLKTLLIKCRTEMSALNPPISAELAEEIDRSIGSFRPNEK